MTSTSTTVNDRSFMTSLVDRVTFLIRNGAVTTSELPMPLLLKIVLCHYAGRRNFKSIKWVLGALLYIATPNESVPADAIPLFGFADDEYVINWVMKELASEIDEFKYWLKSQPQVDNQVLLQESLERTKDNTSSIPREANYTMTYLFRLYTRSLGERTSGESSTSGGVKGLLCPCCPDPC